MMVLIGIIIVIIVSIGLLLNNELFNIGNIFGNKNSNLQKIEDQLKIKLEDKKNIDNKKTSNKITSNKITSNKITSNRSINEQINNKTKKVIEKLTTDDQSELNFDNSDIFNDYNNKNKTNKDINFDESDMSFDGSININTNTKKDMKIKVTKEDIKSDSKDKVNEKLFKDFQKYMEKVNEKKNINKMHKLAEELSKKQNVVKQNVVKQNLVKQNVVKQNTVKQNVSNPIDTLSISVNKQSDNDDEFDLTDTISGIINNELNNVN